MKGRFLIMVIALAAIAILGVSTMVGTWVRPLSRDEQRVTDLRWVATELEAYYVHNGSYPVMVTSWPEVQAALIRGGVAVSSMPADPDQGRAYGYCATTKAYILAAVLDDESSPFLQADLDGDYESILPGCRGAITGRSPENCNDSARVYCVSAGAVGS
jgi:hypothetical protein